MLAGGTDLLPLMRRGVDAPTHLVSLKDVPGLDNLSVEEDGALHIGSRVRISQLLRDLRVGDLHPVLAQAAARIATPQIRNAATVGGNLCQRPRCYYFRHPDFTCARRGGEGCPAMGGQNRYHAIFGNHGCAIVHPSDLAPALIALDAEAVIAGGSGQRILALSDFFVGPQEDPRRETALAPGEMVTAVIVPPRLAGWRGCFTKVTERRVSDFALASIAAMVRVEAGDVTAARVVLGGVAPTPLRRRDLEAALIDGGLTAETVERVANLAVASARPLTQNGYKVRLTTRLVRRSLSQLSEEQVPDQGRGQ